MTRCRSTAATLTLALCCQTLHAFAQDDAGIDASILKPRPYSPYADRAFPTNVYFGDEHVHTAVSGDAAGAGTTLGPRDAYRYARGEQVTTNTGQQAKMRQPLDFFMITDHSDAMGAIGDIIAGAPTSLPTRPAATSTKSSTRAARRPRRPRSR